MPTSRASRSTSTGPAMSSSLDEDFDVQRRVRVGHDRRHRRQPRAQRHGRRRPRLRRRRLPSLTSTSRPRPRSEVQNYIKVVDDALSRGHHRGLDASARSRPASSMQTELRSKLMDTIDKGVGTLVDAEHGRGVHPAEGAADPAAAGVQSRQHRQLFQPEHPVAVPAVVVSDRFRRRPLRLRKSRATPPKGRGFFVAQC